MDALTQLIQLLKSAEVTEWLAPPYFKAWLGTLTFPVPNNDGRPDTLFGLPIAFDPKVPRNAVIAVDSEGKLAGLVKFW